MGCNTKNKLQRIFPTSIDIQPKLENLKEKGRIKFFFHSPHSSLPIRDIHLGKTEPHIEKNAENYCSRCYQNETIQPFLISDEKYLFLFTTNRDSKSPYNNYRYIVGYLEKQNYKKIEENHYSVIGKINLYNFKDAFPLIDIVLKKDKVRNYRVLKIDTDKTTKILEHFKTKTNIYDSCLEEIIRLKNLVKN
ncbi:MAG: hypothetical protein JSS63_10570 [Bacteroidetes bacterium]|nr:hypothetical protein [Bacteroidota bacterium]